MKKIFFSICVLFLVSCKQKNEDGVRKQNNAPHALQDEKSYSKSFKKRGSEDMVDELYDEAIKNSNGLAILENKITDLVEMKNDSLRIFEKYKVKNQDYYSAVFGHLNMIHDSLLKKQIDAVFETDKTRYSNIIARLEQLSNELDKRSTYTADHRIVLKLFVTLGMMQQYRKANTPPSTLLESVLNEYQALNNKIDSAINKNK